MQADTGLMNTRSSFVALSEPCFEGKEWEYVKECLDSGWVSSVGSFVTKFETSVADRCGCKYAVATVNGTSALHIALLLAGVEAGDEVVVPDLTFVATANAVRYAGAWPVLVDCDPRYWQMDPEKVASFLYDGCERRSLGLFNRASGRRVAAIMPVHILGHPCEMDRIGAMATEFQIPIVEDASESLGATFAGRATGSFGLAGCFSFNGNKILTTGAGGMLVTDDADLAARARHLTTQAKSDPEEYIHDCVGFNYRLANVLAAIGCAQMESLDRFLKAKKTVARKYREALAGVRDIVWQETEPRSEPNHWLPTLRLLRPEKKIRDLRRYLASEGIQTRCVWQPMHRNAAFAEAQMVGGAIAENLYETSLSLPSSVRLTEAQQGAVVSSIIRGLSKI